MPACKRKLITLEAPAFSAAQQKIGPLERSLWVDRLRLEMIDIGAVRIHAIHAALTCPHHALKRRKRRFDCFGLSRGLPFRFNIQFVLAAYGIEGELAMIQISLRRFRQSGSLYTAHAYGSSSAWANNSS
jgi:hypothetical protein